MRAGKFVRLFCCCCLVLAAFAFSGCGDDDNPVGPSAPKEGSVSGNGVASGYVSGSSSKVPTNIRGNICKSITDPAKDVKVMAGDYDGNGKFVQFGSIATTTADGAFKITGLPTDRKNIVVRAEITKDLVYEGVIPEIPSDTKIASIPYIDIKTTSQAKLVYYAEKADAACEINIGEIMSFIGTDKLPSPDKLSELEEIAKTFVNREKAQRQIFAKFIGTNADTKFQDFRKYVFELQREIYEGIWNGLYSEDEGWKLFDDKLQEKVLHELELPPVVMLALGDIDENVVGKSMSSLVDSCRLEVKKTLGNLESIVSALNVMQKNGKLSLNVYNAIADNLTRLSDTLKLANTQESAQSLFKGDVLGGLIQSACNEVFENLNLFSLKNGSPLIAQLYLSQPELDAIKTSTGITSGLEFLTLSTVSQTTTSSAPDPDKLARFHDLVHAKIVAKIKGTLSLNDVQADALYVLIWEAPSLGFMAKPAEIITSPGSISMPESTLMGIIVKLDDGNLYVAPPENFARGPFENGTLAKLDAGSAVNGVAITATTIARAYTGTYTAPPQGKIPPVFKITGYAQDVTVPDMGALQKMSFSGGPLVMDAEGNFWFGSAGQGMKFIVEKPTENVAVVNKLKGLIGQLVTITGIIVERSSSGLPKVAVSDVIVKSDAMFIPPAIEVPSMPEGGTSLNDITGIFSLDEKAVQPKDRFKFSWTNDDGTTNMAYVDFDRLTLDKTPTFDKHELWESAGHTVTVSGRLYTQSDVQRLFITKLVDNSTEWPNLSTPFTPTEPPLPINNQLGIFTITNNEYNFAWKDSTSNATITAVVDIDYDKLPPGMTQTELEAALLMSNGKKVTLSGMYFVSEGRLLLTSFSASEQSPDQPTEEQVATLTDQLATFTTENAADGTKYKVSWSQSGTTMDAVIDVSGMTPEQSASLQQLPNQAPVRVSGAVYRSSTSGMLRLVPTAITYAGQQ